MQRLGTMDPGSRAARLESRNFGLGLAEEKKESLLARFQKIQVREIEKMVSNDLMVLNCAFSENGIADPQ